MVLVVDSQLEVSKGNPGRFTAPARMDNLAVEGEQLAESRARVWCVLLFHAGDKFQGAHRGRANGNDAASLGASLLDLVRGVWRDEIFFRMQAMLFDLFRADWLKGA